MALGTNLKGDKRISKQDRKTGSKKARRVADKQASGKTGGFLYEFRFRRLRRSFAYEGRKLDGPESAANFLRGITAGADRESFYALYLDVRGALIGFETVATGGLAGVEVHPREVFRGAILAGAFGVIVAHNHPSGDSTPSKDDLALTRRLKEAGDIVGIPLYDHIIVADGAPYHSIAGTGAL